MNVWKSSRLIGIYTLTQTHCGTGQTTGAVDLPVARDAVTQFPILPATTLKGVARDYAAKDDPGDSTGLDDDALKLLFGMTLDEAEGSATDAQLEAGALVFTEGRLVAFPVRSLNRAFLHVTCPLVLEKLTRDLRVQGIDGFLKEEWYAPAPAAEEAARDRVWVADRALANQPLVLEDLVYEKIEVVELTGLRSLGERLAELIPQGERFSRQRLASGLVLVPDEDFVDLMQRVVPVHARIKLKPNKTADNLWYEESLPADCLFVSVIGERRQRRSAGPGQDRRPPGQTGSNALATLDRVRERLGTVQIGGNETVGQGLCWWTFHDSAEVGAR